MRVIAIGVITDTGESCRTLSSVTHFQLLDTVESIRNSAWWKSSPEHKTEFQVKSKQVHSSIGLAWSSTQVYTQLSATQLSEDL